MAVVSHFRPKIIGARVTLQHKIIKTKHKIFASMSSLSANPGWRAGDWVFACFVMETTTQTMFLEELCTCYTPHTSSGSLKTSIIGIIG